jgi:signal transduction histidine kinase
LGADQPEHRVQYRVVHPDGAVRWIDSRGALVPGPSGRPSRLIGVATDITDRIEVEERARKQEAQARLARYEALRADVSTALSADGRLPAILQQCTEAMVRHLGVALARIWTFDTQAQVLEFQAGAGKYRDADARFARVPLQHPLNLGCIARERRPYLTNDLERSPRFAGPHWAKGEGFTSFAGYPLVVGEQLVGVMVLFAYQPLPEDLAPALGAIADALAQGLQRRRAELELDARVTELARSNAELEQFAYVASHDLQEPLRMVASFSELLARRYQGQLDEKAHRYIQFAVDGVTRMQRLIQDLLAFSRVGTQGQPPTATDSQLVLGRALGNLAAAIAERGARVTADPLPTVRADEIQLEQLLQNLIGNALKFCAPDVSPRIHLSARREGSEWIFSVRDNGIGIEPLYFDRIFVIFQRLHGKERYPGTGMGLAICKKIVERHGGRIWVESTPGQGSTFSFTLPAAG